MLADALIAKDCVKNAVVSGVKVGSICDKKDKSKFKLRGFRGCFANFN